MADENTTEMTTLALTRDDKARVDAFAQATHRNIKGTMSYIVENFLNPELKKLARRTDKSASAA